MSTSSEHKIAIITYDGISLFHLSIPCTIFSEDVDKVGTRQYKVIVCTENPGMVQTLSGFPIEIRDNFSAMDTADTIIVPAWCDPEVHPSEVLLDALRRAHARGARIVGLCLGSFVLAEAGLLDGREASTHWVWAEEFALRFPKVRYNKKVLYIDDGDILTSAGAAAAIDCCVHMVRCDYGADVANRIARRMVVAPHRSGGQIQYIERPLPRFIDSARLEPAISWAINHLTETISLNDIAKHANMSRRNFSRLFKKATGITFTNWLLNRRLELAQGLLETNNLSIDLISSKAGFKSSVTFRQHFLAEFSISPSEYRKQFRDSASTIH